MFSRGLQCILSNVRQYSFSAFLDYCEQVNNVLLGKRWRRVNKYILKLSGFLHIAEWPLCLKKFVQYVSSYRDVTFICLCMLFVMLEKLCFEARYNIVQVRHEIGKVDHTKV